MEAVQTLKQELRTNYQKYFKESFADRDFKNKWKEWEELRNKIAHNNLFTSQDLQRGIVLAEEIIAIVTSAEQSTAELIITQSEREAIQEQVIAKSEASKAESLPVQSGKHITEEEFLAELRSQELHYATKRGGFVGLTRFVRFHLGELGFDYRASHEMIARLEQAGEIEVYYVENPYARDLSTAALRTS